jgi:hypothetical protein
VKGPIEIPLLKYGTLSGNVHWTPQGIPRYFVEDSEMDKCAKCVKGRNVIDLRCSQT